MKRIICTAISLLLTLSAVLLLPACSGKNQLPADYVKGDEAVIDNETPYIYDPAQNVIMKVTDQDGIPWEYDVYDYGEGCCYRSDDKTYTYDSVIKYYGNKPIRMLETEEETLYYTVYSLDDNTLCYIYFEKEGEDYILEQCYQVDVRDDEFMVDITHPHDLPSAIIGDKLPARCYLDYYEPEEIERRNNLQWEFYGEDCSRAGIPTDPFVSDFYCELYAQGRHKEVEGAIRCIQSVSFDTEEGAPEDEDYTVHHGAYFYDIYVFTDGTGVLFFTHFNTDVYPRYAVWQREEIKLSVAEVAKLQSLLDSWNFNDIPTWNPEEFSGFDGETTTVFTTGLGHHNLTSMWSASERDAVYHIRTAIEDLVRAHVTVEEGRIYNSERDR